MTTGDIVAHLEGVYDANISWDLVSRVTEQVLGDMRDWAARPLDAIYPVILIDAIVLKVRSGSPKHLVQRGAPRSRTGRCVSRSGSL